MRWKTARKYTSCCRYSIVGTRKTINERRETKTEYQDQGGWTRYMSVLHTADKLKKNIYKKEESNVKSTCSMKLNGSTPLQPWLLSGTWHLQ